MIFKYKNYEPEINKSAFIAPSADVIGQAEIAKDVSVWFATVIRADVNHIKIGERTNIQDGSVLHVTHSDENSPLGSPLIIGSDCTIGHKVILHGCTIEDGCLIGMGSTILDDVVIGKESLVGACSLVTKGKKFPPRSLIMGSPAKLIRELSEDEVRELYASAARYVAVKNEYM